MVAWWRYGMRCLVCGFSDSGRGILKARDFLVEEKSGRALVLLLMRAGNSESLERPMRRRYV